MQTDTFDNMFNKGDIAQHRKGGIYVIIETPERCRIESENLPAYAYAPIDNTDGGILWIRPKNEMEDGRFVKIENRNDGDGKSG